MLVITPIPLSGEILWDDPRMATQSEGAHKREPSHPGIVATGFAAGLLASYFMPTEGWPLYVLLVLAVALLGGYIIGRWWAVGLAIGCNMIFALLNLYTYNDVFRIGRHHDPTRIAVILLGQSLVSVTATAMAVRLRRGSRSAHPSWTAPG